jgi:site-specific DNA-methyltransferase (adenine-specific)
MGKSSRNKTIEADEIDRDRWRQPLVSADSIGAGDLPTNRVIHGDTFDVLPRLPENSVDLIVADPPYNLSKDFGDRSFSSRSMSDYREWLSEWLADCADLLKPTGTLYICGDWRSSPAIYRAAESLFQVRNRITWKREKGRGAKTNWKNSSEDIWFCTLGDDYTFNVEDVKMKRRVVAPYTDEDGEPRDWEDGENGQFRLTHPSNVWTEMTVPFWSMAENTEHPTQKPEKLLAKLILASSNEGDLVLDPFLGSGTTAVVARKLDREYLGIEVEEDYACIAEKRLDMAEDDDSIQGFTNGVFWERNTGKAQKKARRNNQE